VLAHFFSDPTYHPHLNNRHAAAFFLLCVIVFLIYSNTYSCSWHFDDYQNIIGNSRLHIDQLNLGSIKDLAFAHPNSDRLYRPIPMISFALNWYMGKDQVWGYHLVNTIIHFINACLLFLTIQLLMKTPVGKERQFKNNYFIALLAALIWAVHPIQTQAVTYIVQRMASLATLFYLLSIYLYLKFRLPASREFKIFLAGGCVLSFLASILSKENALMLPFSILLVEFVFFRDFKNVISLKLKQKKISFISVAIGLSVLFILGVYFSFEPIVHLIEKSYSQRPFTLLERLMTEPRILVFYLSLILYPLQSRLSIGHIIPTSNSLFDPITTLVSAVFIIVLIGYSIFQLKRQPYFSFGVLFYFINHIIESSFLGLELVYEHRNYLPTLFLFIPIAAVFFNFINYYYNRNVELFYFLIPVGVILIYSIGSTTYSRNFDWHSEKTLWENVLVKYPESTRAWHNLAYGYYGKIGDYNTALKLYAKALSLDWSNNSKTFRKAITLNNVAGIYYAYGMDRKAIEFWDSAIKAYPSNIKAMFGKAEAQIALGEFDNALQTLNSIPTKQPMLKCLNLRALVFYHQDKYHKAIEDSRYALQLAPLNADSLICIGSAYAKIGQFEKSRFFLKTAHSVTGNDVKVSIMLLEDAIRMSDSRETEKYLSIITNSDKKDHILSILRASKRYDQIPLNLEIIIPELVKQKYLNADNWIKSMESLVGIPGITDGIQN